MGCTLELQLIRDEALLADGDAAGSIELFDETQRFGLRDPMASMATRQAGVGGEDAVGQADDGVEVAPLEQLRPTAGALLLVCRYGVIIWA